ncbi:MAG TPA: L-seryl-tRNA(Sec) selenium transferase [Solirubrobacteraceae bacterium]|jgi:L-seryl-tRNA(Ser) seleniumtransferase|nr:L-seryl-tRNA(Sec) selenium transferase [Solirubrobacteraceae bacterium]
MNTRENPEISDAVRQRLRDLPAVDQLAEDVRKHISGNKLSAVEATAAARAVLTQRRAELLAGNPSEADLCSRAHARLAPPLRHVLNGTGVVVHTNLGRAPLAEAAADAVAATARGYLNLELDLTTGRRGSRNAHISDTLCELTGAEDALAVNNAAGAVLLAAAALGGPERSIVVSRGQLVEIGGGFRIPDVVAQTCAKLIEVGTTNRTRLEDYRSALAAGADLILRVHPSNFRAVGYVEEVSIEALCDLGVPVIDDVGSGVLADHLDVLTEEPAVKRSVRAGASIVCFSGDKLLGGPQAGIMVGSATAIEACRNHPLVRALRIGRLPLAGLVATLALYRDPERALREIPVLTMLKIDHKVLLQRAERLAKQTGGEIIDAVARVGGGALPILELTGPAVALSEHLDPICLAATLRESDPPLLTRIVHNRVTINPRTLPDTELDTAAAVICRAQTQGSPPALRSPSWW